MVNVRCFYNEYEAMQQRKQMIEYIGRSFYDDLSIENKSKLTKSLFLVSPMICNNDGES